MFLGWFLKAAFSGGARNICGNSYLNSATVLFDNRWYAKKDALEIKFKFVK